MIRSLLDMTCEIIDDTGGGASAIEPYGCSRENEDDEGGKFSGPAANDDSEGWWYWITGDVDDCD